MQHWPDYFPDFWPAVLGPLPQGGGMLDGAKHGTVSVIVKLNKVRSPENNDGEAGGQANTHCRPQALWPRINRSNWRSRPVKRTHEPAHLSSTGEGIIDAWPHCPFVQAIHLWTSS